MPPRIPRRQLSTGVKFTPPQLCFPYTYKKLSALPFTRTPANALKELSWRGYLRCKGYDSFQGALDGLGYARARFLPSSASRRFKHITFAAVYVPTWIINGLFQIGTVEHQHRSVFLVQDTLLSGTDAPLFSAIPFTAVSPQKKQFPMTAPWNRTLLHQQGMDVHCIPYSISPFSLYRALASLPNEWRFDGETFGSATFLLNTLRTDLVSAFPVLLPVYVAQYTHPTRPDSEIWTLTIDGSSTENTITETNQLPRLTYTKPLLDLTPELYQAGASLNSIRAQSKRGLLPFEIKCTLPSPRSSLAPGSNFFSMANWCYQTFRDPTTLTKLKELSKGLVANDRDPRIQWMLTFHRDHNASIVRSIEDFIQGVAQYQFEMHQDPVALESKLPADVRRKWEELIATLPNSYKSAPQSHPRWWKEHVASTRRNQKQSTLRDIQLP